MRCRDSQIPAKTCRDLLRPTENRLNPSRPGETLSFPVTAKNQPRPTEIGRDLLRPVKTWRDPLRPSMTHPDPTRDQGTCQNLPRTIKSPQKPPHLMTPTKTCSELSRHSDTYQNPLRPALTQLRSFEMPSPGETHLVPPRPSEMPRPSETHRNPPITTDTRLVPPRHAETL